ncbi:MAG: hypothetical protein B9S32_10910 [Verrucomicrobia bacterium Tous-C9LFEB]|nr:MAG: hypothetical protein B9S32_10910 [Verrucomicrobia bacterium Tous-C9LFEB]
MNRHLAQRRGFTLVEMLVVISVILVLSTLAMSGFRSAMNMSRSAKCMGNLRQLGEGILLYAADNNNFLPPAYISGNNGPDNNWYYAIYPYLTGGTKMPYDWGQETVIVGRGVFHCPEVKNNDAAYILPWISYKMNGQFQFLSATGVMSMAAISKPSQTLLLGEGRAHPKFSSYTSKDQGTGLWYPHNGKLNGLFLDGHIESQTESELKSRWTQIGSFSLN